MAEQGLEGSQPVDLSKHPSGIVPTLQNLDSSELIISYGELKVKKKEMVNNKMEMMESEKMKARSVGQVHGQVVASGATKCVYTCNNLIKAYTCLGFNSHAYRFLLSIPHSNVVSWTILISGFSKTGLFPHALSCFRQMLSSRILPNHVTLSTILPAFPNLGLLSLGKSVHAFWLRRLYPPNVITDTCFLHMYSRFGFMSLAHTLFDAMPLKNIASWNVLISGYANNGMPAPALRLFNLIRCQNVGFTDHLTFLSLFPAAPAPAWGRMSTSAIHSLLVKSGCNIDLQLQTALIKMYASCRFIDEAHRLFREMPAADLVAWTLMLQGFSSCQQWSKAIQHFGEMVSVHGKALDSTAFVGIISSCIGSGALLHGRRVHALVFKQGFSNDVYVGSALIDMYTSCGDLDSGKRFFDAAEEKDVACWNAMIKAMGANGNGKDAVNLFWRMEGSGFKPNDSTLISVLSSCSHAGMIDQGLQIFCHMIERWGLVPGSQHYACLVDMLGRSGRLDDAHSIIKNMPVKPHIEAYGALLSACKTHGNSKMGGEMFQQLLKLGYKGAGHFCSVLNMYASVGDWEGAEMSNKAQRLEGVKKDPGFSLIELN